MPRPGWLAPSVVGAAALSVMSGASQFGVTATLGDVAVELGEATTSEVAGQIGMSATTLGLGLAVVRLAGAGSLVGASLADRLGRRRVLLVATAVGLVLTMIATGAPTFWTFVVLIALGRPLLSTTNAVSAVVAAEVPPPRGRTAALALVGASYAAGAGMVSVGRGIFDAASFRTVLLVASLPVLLIPLVARILAEPEIAARLEAGADPERPRTRLGTVTGQWVRPLVVLCVLAAASNLVSGPAFTYLFVYGENVLGASAGTMSLLVLAAGPTGLAGLWAGRFAAERVGRRITCVTATTLVAVSATAMYAGGFVLLAGGYLATILFSAALGPAVGALLSEVMPTRYRGTANGWVAATGVAGAVIGLTSFGALSEALGSFSASGAWLWLPVVPVAFLYLLLPETVGIELDELDPAPLRTPPG